ncbi:MAG: cyclic nucleotide-gated ion channel [Alphaproteobacteria bacterium]
MLEVLAVGLGVAAVFVGTMPAVAGRFDGVLTGVALVLAGLFLAEYVVRLRLASRALPAPGDAGPGGPSPVARIVRGLRWAASPFGLIDLLAAFPVPIALAAGMSTGDARLFGALWIFKLVRYTPAVGLLGRVLRNERRALVGVLVAFAIILVLAATLAHLVERGDQPDAFGSIPAALWWAVTTLTTTGYGDRVPVTMPGRMLGGVVMICGIGTFALWAGILATGFAQEIRRQSFLETWDLVARVPLFHALGPGTIADMTRLLRRLDLGAEQIVIREGRPGDCMYFVVEGEVAVHTPSGPILLEAGSFFGELALITGEPRTATVRTVRPTILLELDVVDFRALAASRPELLRIVEDEAARRRSQRPAANRDPARVSPA